MADTLTPRTSTERPVREITPASDTSASKNITELKVAEKREDGTVVLELEDGRMLVATLKDGVEGIRKGSTVNITADSFLEDGTPENPVVVKVQ